MVKERRKGSEEGGELPSFDEFLETLTDDDDEEEMNGKWQ